VFAPRVRVTVDELAERLAANKARQATCTALEPCCA
jgi:hypothetical protein